MDILFFLIFWAFFGLFPLFIGFFGLFYLLFFLDILFYPLYQEKIGRILAKWVVENLSLKGEKPDLLVSVPLHPKKLKERGYNQLHLFTEVLSSEYGIPFDHNLLKRNSHSQAQAQKDKSHREETKYDFSLTKEIENQHILLVDDVFTTGNTMSAIAWEFLKNKKNKVSILVMAIDC